MLSIAWPGNVTSCSFTCPALIYTYISDTDEGRKQVYSNEAYWEQNEQEQWVCIPVARPFLKLLLLILRVLNGLLVKASMFEFFPLSLCSMIV